MSNLAAILAALPDAERRAALSELSASELAALEYAWPVWARPDQLPPPRIRDGHPDWRTWLMLAGRGSGKSRSAAEWIRSEVESGRRRSIGLIGPTAETLRRDQVAAILTASPPWNMPIHEPSQRRLVWPNGAVAYALSSEEPDRIRGLNLDAGWWDEFCASSNQEDVYSNYQLALRVPGPLGDSPATVITTTPRRSPLLMAIMADPSTVVTRASTFANAANLDPAALAALERRYVNTTLGRQELMGEILDDVDGALWNRAMLEETRVPAAPEHFRRVVISIDPAGTSKKGSDETGIVAAAIGRDGHFYVLCDASRRYSPDAWARTAVDLYRSLKADRIVAEANFGGEMVQSTIRSVDPHVPVRMVTASRGKAVRAEPIVALFEQRRAHLVGNLQGLEDQLCGWDPNASSGSPDRLDAMVWALTDLAETRPPLVITDEILARVSRPLPGYGRRPLLSLTPQRSRFF